MDSLQLLLGVALLVVVFNDVVQTTLTLSGAGRLSLFLSKMVWKPLLSLERHRRVRGLLSAVAPVIVLLYFWVWFTLLWIAWSLIFASGDTSVIESATGDPADWSGLLYFIGFTIITLGVGDYVPQGALWQMLTVVASASGFFLVTMVITYILSVLSAVIAARGFANQVSGLGKSGSALVRAGWNGADLRSLDLPLNNLASTLAVMTEQYLAYPILHYYHAHQKRKAPIEAVLILNEALLLLSHGASKAARPSPAVLKSAHSAVQTFVNAMPSEFKDLAADTPRPPDLQPLRDAGVPTVDDEDFHSALKRHAKERRALLGLLREDGWEQE